MDGGRETGRTMEYFLEAYKLGVNEESQNHMTLMPPLVARKLKFLVIKGTRTTNK